MVESNYDAYSGFFAKIEPGRGGIMSAAELVPIEILHLIAAESRESYRAMLSVPAFARSLDPGIIVDYMISFGYSIEITKNSIKWKYRGQLHRIGGPAVECIDELVDAWRSFMPVKNIVGSAKFWYRHGLLHRTDGPAVICSEHTRWYCGGKPHRLDGPALEYPDGSYEWYYKGLRHREGGPAVRNPRGDKLWFWDDRLHRLDGPAIEYADGTYEWYQNGEKVGW